MRLRIFSTDGDSSLDIFRLIEVSPYNSLEGHTQYEGNQCISEEVGIIIEGIKK